MYLCYRSGLRCLVGCYYRVCQFSYLVLIDDFVLHVTDMNNEDVALGMTLLGKMTICMDLL